MITCRGKIAAKVVAVVAIAENECLEQPFLCEHLARLGYSSDGACVSRIARDLRLRGMITKKQSAFDRRRNVLEITYKGYEYLDQVSAQLGITTAELVRQYGAASQYQSEDECKTQTGSNFCI